MAPTMAARLAPELAPTLKHDLIAARPPSGKRRASARPTPMPSDAPPQLLPQWRIVVCALAMCGIQVCYAAQINMGTSQLLALGISESAVSLAWLAGPLSGLIVQPIVGLASDSCTSPLGRRRPFLIAGTIFSGSALLLFSNSVPISNALFSETVAQHAALAIAVCAFFLLDFSIQAIQAPLRALITDVVPQPQRARGNAYVGFFTGLGNLIGGLLAATRLSVIFPFFGTDVQALFALATITLVLSVGACVMVTDEVPLNPNYNASDYQPIGSNYDDSPRRNPITTSSGHITTALLEQPRDDMDSVERASSSSISRWTAVVKALRGIPRPFWQVFAVQLCTWCGFFTLFVYVNTWVGMNVYLGKGSAPAGSLARDTFERGVRLGGKGNALTAMVTLAYSLALPGLLDRFGVLIVYAFSQLVEALCLMVAPLIRGTAGQTAPSALLRVATLLDIGMFGIVWATTMGVPWTLIGNALDSDPEYAQRLGLYTTLFNASQSFPQLIVAFAAPLILASAGNDPSFVMFAGGLCAFIGVLLVFLLRVDKYASSDMSDEEDAIDVSESRGNGRLKTSKSMRVMNGAPTAPARVASRRRSISFPEGLSQQDFVGRVIDGRYH